MLMLVYQLSHDGPRIVRRAVVDEHDLGFAATLLAYTQDRIMQRREGFLFIHRWNDKRKFWLRVGVGQGFFLAAILDEWLRERASISQKRMPVFRRTIGYSAMLTIHRTGSTLMGVAA